MKHKNKQNKKKNKTKQRDLFLEKFSLFNDKTILVGL